MLKLVFVVLAILAVASAQYVYNYPYAYSGYSASYPAVSAVRGYTGYTAGAAYPYYANSYPYIG